MFVSFSIDKNLLCLGDDIQLWLSCTCIHILYDSLVLMNHSLQLVLNHPSKNLITKINFISKQPYIFFFTNWTECHRYFFNRYTRKLCSLTATTTSMYFNTLWKRCNITTRYTINWYFFTKNTRCTATITGFNYRS